MQKITSEMIKALKAPLPKEAVKPHPTKSYLSSIKAIYVVERLNDVFGIGGWFIDNTVVKEEGKWVVVKSTFTAPEYGVVIKDIFGGNDNADMGDAYKGACTDALTKIGSYLYIGMDVYKGFGDKTPSANGEEKKPNTTLYNHKATEKNGLPAINNAQFKKTCERITAGELDIYYKAQAEFSMTKEQAEIMKDVYDDAKKQKA